MLLGASFVFELKLASLTQGRRGSGLVGLSRSPLPREKPGLEGMPTLLCLLKTTREPFLGTVMRLQGRICFIESAFVGQGNVTHLVATRTTYITGVGSSGQENLRSAARKLAHLALLISERLFHFSKSMVYFQRNIHRTLVQFSTGRGGSTSVGSAISCGLLD
jgi:hypothetical protein